METQRSRKKTGRKIMYFAGILSNDLAEGIKRKVEKQRADADREFLEQMKQRST
jgi:hypothetical protein